MIAGAATAGFASPAHAQTPAPQTPQHWNYQIDPRGRRVPRISRITNPDGSWREEIRQGDCLTVKQRSASGEYRETRHCRPGKPG